MKRNPSTEKGQKNTVIRTDTVMDLIWLIRCALSRTKPDVERVAGMDQQKLYKLSAWHSLDALVGTAMSGAGDGTGAGAMEKRWKAAVDQAVRRTALFDAERSEFLRFMEENGIWYMPLKGVVLKDLYPHYGIRQMSDNDILFDVRHAEKVRDWFRGRGYKVKKYALRVHDTYLKEPIYNFEMHRTLFSPSKETWYAYYANVKERLIKDEGNGCGFHFTDEDFYVYFFAHAAKHYKGGGTGLRMLVDLYLYASKKTDLDWSYIERELKKLGLMESEKEMRELAATLFSGDTYLSEQALSPRQRELLSGIISSGTYGTVETQIGNKLERYTKEKKITGKTRLKLHYLRERFFPTTPEHREYYAFYYQHWWGRPLLLFVRFVKLLINRKRVKKEFEALRRF